MCDFLYYSGLEWNPQYSSGTSVLKNYILQGHIKKQDKERHYPKEIFMGLKFGQVKVSDILYRLVS